MSRIICFLLCLSYSLVNAQQKGELTVRVGNFIQPIGTVVVFLYDSLSRSKKAPIQIQSAPINSDEASVVFSNLPSGRYGISAFQDLNRNSQLDFTQEDYGLSNGALAQFGPPSFHQIAFSFDGTHKKVFVQLENEKASKTTRYVGRRIFTPVFGYTPETSVILGANLIKFFRLNELDTASRTSFVDVLGAITFKEQIITDLNYTFFTDREKYMFIGNIGFQKFPQYYYGVGNDLSDSNKQSISYDQFIFSPLFLRNVYRKIYAGVGYRYNNLFNLQDGNLHSLENSQVTGYKGSIASGIQFCLTSDNRDNIYNTSKGHLVRLKYGINNSAFGSQFDFRSFEADVRGFIKLGRQTEDVLALQLTIILPGAMCRGMKWEPWEAT